MARKDRAPRRRLTGLTLAGVLVAGAVSGTGLVAAHAVSASSHVGDVRDNGTILATGQGVKPYGTRIKINNGRLLASNLSPDGKTLAASTYRNGTGFLSLFDVADGRLIQQVGTGVTGDPKIGDGTVAADGPIWSPDGTTLWLPQTADLLKFAVSSDGSVATTPTSIAMKTGADSWLPSGGAFNADGSKLYLALNNLNTLARPRHRDRDGRRADPGRCRPASGRGLRRRRLRLERGWPPGREGRLHQPDRRAPRWSPTRRPGQRPTAPSPWSTRTPAR